MNLNKILIKIIIIFLLFQDSIVNLLKINLINYIDEILVVGLFILSLSNVIKNKKINLFSAKLLLGTILFSIVGVISCYLNSEFILSRVIMSNFLAIKFWILIISIININIKEATIELIIKTLKEIGIVCCFFAIINFLIPNMYSNIFKFVPIEKRFGINVVSSLFNHPGKYGWYMLMVALIYLVQYSQDKSMKNLKMIAIFVFFAVLSLRTKVLIALLIIGGYLLAKMLKKKKNITYVMIGVIVLGCLAFIFRDYIGNTYTLYFTSEKGYSVRQAMLDNSIKITKEYFPIGVGFGQYGSWYARLYYSKYYYKYNMNKMWGMTPSDSKFATDTFWPAILGETGIIGTILYVYLVLITYNILNKNNKKLSNRKFNYVLLAQLAFIQTLCESFGEPSLNSAPQNIIVALIIGLALNILKQNIQKNEIIV